MTEKLAVWEPLRNHMPNVHWMRLENSVGTGMSDVNGCLNGVEVWVENKVVKGNRIIFQPLQPAWIRARLAHGGRVFVLARKNEALLLWGGRALANLVMSCKPSGKTLVADYRRADPSQVFVQPFDWDTLEYNLFYMSLSAY